MPRNNQKHQQKQAKRKSDLLRLQKKIALPAPSKKLSAPVTNILAIDCEYVGVGYEGKENCLARPTEKVTDFRTHVSGIRYGDIVNGEPYVNIQQEVHKILAGKVVVGHSLHNDFKVLGLTHPARLTRDTAKYRPLRQMAAQINVTPSLKHLAYHILVCANPAG
uniref:Exonuclease domain-containing protein n=1 Tax=Ditylenchus dipsaci TaxID=166011 RepID=A0A915CTU1_9BILA